MAFGGKTKRLEGVLGKKGFKGLRKRAKPLQTKRSYLLTISCQRWILFQLTKAGPSCERDNGPTSGTVLVDCKLLFMPWQLQKCPPFPPSWLLMVEFCLSDMCGPSLRQVVPDNRKLCNARTSHQFSWLTSFWQAFDITLSLQHFWNHRMALDRRNYRQLVDTTVEIANRVGASEIINRLVDDLKVQLSSQSIYLSIYL